jgi:tetratricopeptide (TPR) repeat protein
MVAAISMSLATLSAAHGQPAASVPTAPTAPEPAMLGSAEDALEFLNGLYRPLSDAQVLDAERVVRAALAKNPDDARWPAALALLRRYSPDIADGEAMARRAVESAPGDARSWFALGVYLSTGGSKLPTTEQADRTRAAIGAIERALSIDPSHPGALEMAAEYYSTAPTSAGGSREKSIAMTDRMMAIETIRWRGAELRARVAMVARDWAGVDDWFGKAIGWAPDAGIERELRVQQALLYLNFKRDYEAAMRMALPYAEAGAPDGDRFSFIVGQAAYRMSDFDLARTHHQRVVDAGDPPPNVLLELADCQQRSGDLEGALASIDLYLARFPEHPRQLDAKMFRNRLRDLIAARTGTGE